MSHSKSGERRSPTSATRPSERTRAESGRHRRGCLPVVQLPLGDSIRVVFLGEPIWWTAHPRRRGEGYLPCRDACPRCQTETPTVFVAVNVYDLALRRIRVLLGTGPCFCFALAHARDEVGLRRCFFEIARGGNMRGTSWPFYSIAPAGELTDQLRRRAGSHQPYDLRNASGLAEWGWR